DEVEAMKSCADIPGVVPLLDFSLPAIPRKGDEPWIVRANYGADLRLTAAYRCPHRNSVVTGGAALSRHSYHMIGLAADIVPYDWPGCRMHWRPPRRLLAFQ